VELCGKFHTSFSDSIDLHFKICVKPDEIDKISPFPKKLVTIEVKCGMRGK